MLFDYFFWVVAIGTMALGVASAIIGTTVVLEQQSQLGDAIGHSVFPGIIVSFMLFQTRNPLILMLGAVTAGLVAFQLIQWIHRNSQFSYESILALILSSMFGLGMVLSSYIQGNPAYQKAAQAGLNHYIMGQAAYLVKDDVRLILVVTTGVLLVFALFFPKIKLVLFDKIFAQSIGIQPQRISQLLLVLALLIISIGIKTVGIILVSSMLVAPTVAALQWSRVYHRVIGIAGVIGLVSAFIGTYLSTAVDDLATGPTIVLCQTAFAILSLLLAPNGLLKRKRVTP